MTKKINKYKGRDDGQGGSSFDDDDYEDLGGEFASTTPPARNLPPASRSAATVGKEDNSNIKKRQQESLIDDLAKGVHKKVPSAPVHSFPSRQPPRDDTSDQNVVQTIAQSNDCDEENIGLLGQDVNNLLLNLTNALNNRQPVSGFIGPIVEKSHRILQISPDADWNFSGFTDLSLCSVSEALENAVKDMQTAGAPFGLILALLSKLRSAGRCDLLLKICDALKTNLATGEGEHAKLLEERARIDLALNCSSTRIPLLNQSPEILEDEAVLDGRRRSQSLLDPLFGRNRLFPWFDGRFELNEKKWGQPDVRWLLDLRATDRFTARPVKASFNGRTWEGRLTSSSPSSAVGHGTLYLSEVNGSRKADLTLIDGWVTGTVSDSNNAVHSILAMPFDLNNQLEDVSGVCLNGAWLSTAKTVTLDNRWTIMCQFKCLQPAGVEEQEWMTVIATSQLAIKVKGDLSAVAISVADQMYTAAVGESFQDSRWNQLSVTRDESKVNLFLNSREYLYIDAGALLTKKVAKITLGAEDELGSDPFHGSLFDLRIYKTILTNDAEAFDNSLIMHAPLVRRGPGLWFLQELVNPQQPLLLLSSSDTLHVESTGPVPGPSVVGLRKFDGISWDLVADWRTEINYGLMNKPLWNIESGFQCNIRLALKEGARVDGLHFRLVSQCRLEYPSLGHLFQQEDLKSLVQGSSSGVALSLTSDPSSPGSMCLSCVSRLLDGSLLNVTKVFSISQFVSTDSVDLRLDLALGGTSLSLDIGQKKLCEVPVTFDFRDNVPHYLSLFAQPFPSIELANVSLVLPDRAESGSSARPQTVISLGICDQCGCTMPADSMGVCQTCQTATLHTVNADANSHWNCLVCTFSNISSSQMCEMCGKLRPPSPAQQPIVVIPVEVSAPLPASNNARGSLRQPSHSAWASVTDPKRESILEAKTIQDLHGSFTSRVCPKCTFAENRVSATYCEVCEEILPVSTPARPALLVAPQPPVSTASQSMPNDNEAAVRRLRENFFTAKSSSDASQPLTQRFDSTSGPMTLTLSNETEVVFKCDGQLEGQPVIFEATLDRARDQWRLKGSRVGDGFQATLILDAKGERVLSAEYSSALENGIWTGSFIPLVSTLRGLGGPNRTFKVGLENMRPGLTNVCSQNAVLQSLFACQAFRDILLSSAPTSTDPTMKALGALFLEMETTPERAIGAHELQKCLPAQFRQAEEMDPTELFSQIVASLEAAGDGSKFASLVGVSSDDIKKCNRCGAMKEARKENHPLLILQMGGRFTPILDMYLVECQSAADLPPAGGKRLIGEDEVFVERIPMSLTDPRTTTRFLYLYVIRQYQSSSILKPPVTHIMVGKDSRGGGRLLPVFDSRMNRKLEYDPTHGTVNTYPCQLIFAFHDQFASPITDVQVIQSEDTRSLPGYTRTAEVVRPTSSAYQSQQQAGSGLSLKLAIASNMPISDLFVGTEAEKDAKGLFGYHQSHSSVGEDPESGSQVFLWTTTAVRSGPPVTRINIVRKELADGVEIGGPESLAGRIPLGLTIDECMYVIQVRDGVGSPITSLDIINVFNRQNLRREPYHSIINVEDQFIASGADQERLILTTSQSVGTGQANSHLPGVGFRLIKTFDFDPAPSKTYAPVDDDERPNLVKDTPKVPRESLVHAVKGFAMYNGEKLWYDGVVVENTRDGERQVSLLGEFLVGGNVIACCWSSSSLAWTALAGSSLPFPVGYGMAPVRVYDLAIRDGITRTADFDPTKWRILKKLTGHKTPKVILARSVPLTPDEQPLRRIFVRTALPGDLAPPQLNEATEQVACIFEEFVDEAAPLRNFICVSRKVDEEEEGGKDWFVSEVELLDTLTKPSYPSSGLAKIEDVGELAGLFIRVTRVNVSWDGCFIPTQLDVTSTEQPSSVWRAPQQEPSLLVIEKLHPHTTPLRGHHGTLSFLRQPARVKLEGVFVKDSSKNITEFYGLGTNIKNPRAMFVRGYFSQEADAKFDLKAGGWMAQGQRDVPLSIGIVRDSTEYWEEGHCLFSSRKRGNDMESLISLAGNSEVMDRESDLVMCESDKCRGSKQPHLSTKRFHSPNPLLVLQRSIIMLNPFTLREEKDMRKTPLAPILNAYGCTYALFAVIVHVGASATSGHYFTYAREARPGWEQKLASTEDDPSSRWILYNDASATPVKFEDMVNVLERGHSTEAPYLYFYWQVDGPTNGSIPHRPETVINMLIEEGRRREFALASRVASRGPYLDALRIYMGRE